MAGHSVTEPLVPALVPLVLPAEHWIRSLAGLTLPAEVTLRAASGKRVFATTGSTLCTHVGLSGPAILDVSRHWLVARFQDPGVVLALNWLPGETADSVDRLLVAVQGRGPVAALRGRLSERLIRTLCEQAAASPTGDLSREARRRLVAVVTATPWPKRPPAACRWPRCGSTRWRAASAPASTWPANCSTSTAGSGASISSGPGRAGS